MFFRAPRFKAIAPPLVASQAHREMARQCAEAGLTDRAEQELKWAAILDSGIHS